MQLRMMAVGDMLIHMEIVSAAGGDYSMLFRNMKDTFSRADILIGNQETVLTDSVAPRGFPVFATPTAVGTAEAEAGFSLVTCASNHTLDNGDRGMVDETAFWEAQPECLAIGIRRRGEPFRPTVLERNGIRLAFLNYTEPMNLHINLPFFSHYVERLRPGRKREIAAQISASKEAADAVVVLPHWGTEYLYAPTERQREWAEFFAECGADLIIGTHPHVLQPLEILSTGDGRSVPVFWSLGNYISAQKRPGTMLGGLADCLWVRDDSGVRIEECSLAPLAASTDSECSDFTVYTLEDYPDELSASNRLFGIIEREYGIKTDKAYLEDLFDGVFSGEAQRNNPFQTPGDVLRYNINRVFRLIFRDRRERQA